MHRQAELLEVVGALRPAGRLASRLDRGKQQRDQHRDDGDDDQEFNQCEGTTISNGHGHDPSPLETE